MKAKAPREEQGPLRPGGPAYGLRVSGRLGSCCDRGAAAKEVHEIVLTPDALLLMEAIHSRPGP